MKFYPSEKSLEGRTGWSDKTIRQRLRSMVFRIRGLKAKKIVWPEAWNDPHIDSPIFIASVDGTHCPICEPTKGYPYSKNPKYMSHKFHRSALAYEVALSIFTSNIVWINGPFPAGTQDPDIMLKPNGLKSHIPLGKKVVADSAYKRTALASVVSISNAMDTKDVRLFKRRVRSRQEHVFSRMKVFRVLTQEFRHGESYHCVVFEAIAVICQIEMDVELPLFDV